MTRSRMYLAIAAALLIGWFSHSFLFPPNCPPKDRPIAKLVARLAKWGLWVFLFAEPPPHDAGHHDHSGVGPDGFPLVDHRSAL